MLIILAIMLIISKIQTEFQVSIHCRKKNTPPWLEQKQHIIFNWQ
jgi:hypothetical protein